MSSPLNSITRRDFLGLSGLSCLSLAWAPLVPPPPYGLGAPRGLGRVASSWIGLYKEPSFRATRLSKLARDELINILTHEVADDGPSHNPVWYRVPDGYVHSGRLQSVRWEPQIPKQAIPPGGALFEISVPYTRTYRQADPASEPFYRLYYQSTAWVEALVVGADGRAWYRLVDDLLKVRYFTRAEHLRWIPPEELAPLSPDVPGHKKRIEVTLADQELRAFEFDELVFKTNISSGISSNEPTENGIPTTTPSGQFYVEIKMALRHMGDGHLTSDLEAYELPGVPWVSFFHLTGVGFHGTYWHNDFGRPMSHGCINMRPEEAKWLYRWTAPQASPEEMRRIGHGTLVLVN